MTKIEAEIVIGRPVEEVFAFVADYDAPAQWQSGVIECKITSENPLGVGSQYKYVAQVLGRRIENHYEVSEYERNKKITRENHFSFCTGRVLHDRLVSQRRLKAHHPGRSGRPWFLQTDRAIGPSHDMKTAGRQSCQFEGLAESRGLKQG